MVKVFPPPFRREVSRIVAASDTKYKLGADYFCDGKDDQIEIQKAIDDVKQTGGTVFLKQGTYFLSGPIVIDKSNVKIEGEGFSTVIKLINGVNDYAIKIVGSAIEGCRVENLYIDGNAANQTAGGCILIDGSAGYARRNWIINNFIDNGKEANIKLYRSASNFITNNFIAGSQEDGIKLDNYSTTNKIIDNEFYNNANY